MAKDPDTVAKFLSDLAEKLQPLWKNEKEEMLKLKEEEVRSLATLLFLHAALHGVFLSPFCTYNPFHHAHLRLM